MIEKEEYLKHALIVEKTAEYVRKKLREAEAGHDWQHVKRVWNNAKYIAQKERKGDLLVIELSALLHDIADAKFHNGDESIGPCLTDRFLRSQNMSEEVITHVTKIVENISFRKRHQSKDFHSIELEILQDADRLDAIGAIGIARVFNFGGYFNRPLYAPGELEVETGSTNGINRKHSIGHFYEKLLLLADMMNTRTGRELAKERHKFMLAFLDQFYREWEGPEAPQSTNGSSTISLKN